MIPSFDFYNCTYERKISQLTTFWRDVQLYVIGFDNVTGTTGNVVENYFVGVDGAQFVNSNVNGRDVVLRIKVDTTAGVLSNKIINAVMNFYGVGNRLRVYSNCNVSHNANAYLEGWVESLDVQRFAENSKNALVLELKLHCANPYWTVEDGVGYSKDITYSADDSGYIVFEHEALETDDNGNALYGFDIYMKFSNTKVTGTQIELSYAGNYDYGIWKDKKVVIPLDVGIFNGCEIRMNTGINYPYCNVNSNVSNLVHVVSDFYLQPHLFGFPNGYKIRCILKATETVATGGLVWATLDYKKMYV